MNKDQFARLERHRKVRQVLLEHAPEIKQIPALAELAGQFQQQLGALDQAARRKPAASEGATEYKGNTAAGLVPRLVKAANALFLLYKKEGNLEAARQLHLRPSAYRTLMGLELATEATDLAKALTERLEALKDYNVTAEAAATLTAAAQAYAASLEAPKLAIETNMLRGATDASRLRELDRFLREDLRAGVELLTDTHPELYQRLRTASSVDDPAYRQRKGLKAKASGTGSPPAPTG